MKKEQVPFVDRPEELNLYRKLLTAAGGVYFIWWFAVHAFLPQSYNPVGSRVAVVLCIFAAYGASFFSRWVQKRLRWFWVASAWLITLHYYVLFYYNAGDTNWVVGAYITVIAIQLCFFSSRVLLAYSIFVFFFSIALIALIPSLRESVFLPGMITIQLQANLGMRARLALIRGLRESNARFQLLFNSTFEGVVVHQKGRIVNVNDALLRMLGYRRYELIGQEPLLILHPDDRVRAAEYMTNAEMGAYEIRGYTKNGESIDIELRGKDFIYNEKPARLVTLQDLRDRKRAEQERIAAMTLAENVRIRDDFISIASHELKTPISALKLQTQLLEMELAGQPAELPGRIREALHLFDRQLLRLNELVESMLDVSRISIGRFTIERRRVDLAAIVRDVLTSPTMTASRQKIEIVADLPPSAFLLGDRRRLEQVVENLITNALKYGAGQSVAVRVWTEGQEICLEVRDHGIGIAEESLAKIFNRFERAVSSRNISGFGLGLYIVKQILDAHGGRISVQSKLREGSTFTVCLPRGNA